MVSVEPLEHLYDIDWMDCPTADMAVLEAVPATACISRSEISCHLNEGLP
jgi:hypothetical protein